MKISEYSNLKKNKLSVTVVVPTKDRYHTTLPMTITSIINQSHKPDKLLIIDDGKRDDLRKIPIYAYLFSTMDQKKIEWEVIFGPRKGPAWCHQIALNNCTTELIWRIDDDEIAESNVLSTLIESLMFDKKIGAVAPLILDPSMGIEKLNINTPLNKIETIDKFPNIQWLSQNNDLKDADHLYSSFLYRVEAAKHGYCLELSNASHREETIFTHQMKRKGWKLVVNPNSTIWHFRNPEGGLRRYQDPSLWKHDQEVFNSYLVEWNKFKDSNKIIILDNGLGDHICFRIILPEINKKYKNITIAACYPEVFEDDNVNLISIQEAKDLLNGNIDRFNIYRFMVEKNWEKSVSEAFMELYL